jgi:hypothetical protein
MMQDISLHFPPDAGKITLRNMIRQMLTATHQRTLLAEMLF